MAGSAFSRIVPLILGLHCLSCSFFSNDDRSQVIELQVNTTIPDYDGMHQKVVNSYLALDSTASEQNIVAVLDTMQLLFSNSYDSSLNQIIAYQLEEHRNIYQGRGGREVSRIRAYTLITLSNIGPDQSIIPQVYALLNNSREPYMLSGCAMVAGQLKERQLTLSLIPLLHTILGVDYKDYSFSLTDYFYAHPIPNVTTMKTEVIKALGRIGDTSSAAMLTQLQGLGDHNEQIKIELTKSIELIGMSGLKGIHGYPSINVSSINKNDITYLDLSDFTFENQRGERLAFSQFKSKPTVLVFFYSSCSNLNKCSETIFQLARLQEALKSTDIKQSVNLVAMTFDPIYDTPTIMKQYASQRGVSFNTSDGPLVSMLRVVNDNPARLFRRLEARVNFGLSRVNAHAIELLIMDHEQRITKTYHKVLWDNSLVIRDLKGLVKEV